MTERLTSLGKTGRSPVDYYCNNVLRDARIAKGYSGKILGEKVGKPSPLIYEYERLRRFPSKIVQEKIAEVLERDVSELFPRDLKEYVNQTNILRGIKKIRRIKRKPKFVPIEGHEEELFYTPDFYGEIFHEELKQGIERLLSKLPKRTREIMELRYGFNGEEHTSAEIGDIYGVSGSYVRQKIVETFRRLAKHPKTYILYKSIEDSGGNK